MSDQKCIYRYPVHDAEPKVCGDTREAHRLIDHYFQPPFEPTDEAVEAALQAMFGNLQPSELGDAADAKFRLEIRAGIEAALSVMQKGQDK